jgi:hypothetical protein
MTGGAFGIRTGPAESRDVEAVLEMAKKKPGPKPDPSRVRTDTIMVRGMTAWKEWVEEFAEFDRATSLSELIDRALVSYARERGFPKQAPKR